MVKYVSLSDVIMLANEYSGNADPGIFLVEEKNKDNTEYAFAPHHVFIDDDGDIILTFVR